MVDLTIIGHCFDDTIYIVNSVMLEYGSLMAKKSRLGGINNVLRGAPELTVQNIGKIAKSLIIEDGVSRQVYVKDLPKIELNCIKTKWVHLCYLDNLLYLNLDEIRSGTTIISADVAHGKCSVPLLEEKIKEIDYLFIASDVSYKIALGSIKSDSRTFKMEPRIGTFSHSPTACDYYDFDDYISENNQYYNRDLKDVVGAGDIFCGNCIQQMIQGKTDISEIIRESHKFTSNELHKRK